MDLAPWNGFFGFECLRRGAAELISFGPDDPDVTGYNKTRDLLEIDNCNYLRAAVYDLSPEVHGQFDVVLFLGLIYHLRHPLLARDRIFDVASNRLFADSPVIDKRVIGSTISEPERDKILEAGKIVNQLPLVYFTKGTETGDYYHCFIPNRRALLDLIESSGFLVNSVQEDGGNWISVPATKAQRTFTLGLLESWHEAATKPPTS